MVERKLSESQNESLDNEAKSDGDNDPQNPYEGITKEEYIEFLQAQVDSFPTLPNHVKYSPATNADLYDLTVILVNIFKKGSNG